MVWEAVLFYVDEDAVRNIMQELFNFCKGGNGDGPRAETMLCFTGKLRNCSRENIFVLLLLLEYNLTPGIFHS